jgi:hypothetical protein
MSGFFVFKLIEFAVCLINDGIFMKNGLDIVRITRYTVFVAIEEKNKLKEKICC